MDLYVSLNLTRKKRVKQASFESEEKVEKVGTFMDNGQFSGILHGQCTFHGQLGLGLWLGLTLTLTLGHGQK